MLEEYEEALRVVVFDLMDQSPRTRQELTLLVDVSKANNSSRACQMIDEFIEQMPTSGNGVTIDLNAGNLLLTKGILLKIKQQFQRAGAMMGTVYSLVPQTQQAALDEGLYVKEKLQSQWTPLRQPLPIQTSEKPKQVISPEITPAKNPFKPLGVELPNFTPSPAKQPEPTAAPPAAAVEPAEAPEIPELASPITEVEAPPVLPSAEILSGATEELLAPHEVVLPEPTFETLYLRHTLRSGQTVRFDGHVVIVGDVHTGSEITAGGDIVVWGELRGIAHAGAKGNFKSEIRAMKIEALQLRIADYIARRPDRIYYHKDGAENVISPETARVADGEIKIFKTALSK